MAVTSQSQDKVSHAAEGLVSPAVPPPLDGLGQLAASFRRSLLAENKGTRTVETFGEALRLLGAFLREKGMPTTVAHLKREHVEASITSILEHWRPATASNRYRALQSFFKWAVDEGELKVSPMANMKPPAIPEAPPEVLTDEQIRALLKTCAGTTLEDRRDTAIIRLFLDTGMRRAECANLTVEDIDLDLNTAAIIAKGRRPRACPFGRKTAQAIDRYLDCGERATRRAGVRGIWRRGRE